MRYIKLTIQTDDESGEVGYFPNIHRNWTNYIPFRAGRTLAHDLLEHGTRELGGIDQEFAALGSYCFVRNFGTVYDGQLLRTPEQALASGISHQYTESSREIQNAPKTYGLSNEDQECFDRFIPDFRLALVADWKEENEDDDFDCAFLDDQIWDKLVDWMKYGFVRAKRRYDNNWWMAWTLFQRVEELLDKTFKHVQDYADSGITFTLALDIENGWAEMMDSPYLMIGQHDSVQ